MSSGFVKSLGDKKYYEDALNDWIEYDSKSNQTVLDQPTTYQYLKDNVY